MHAKKIESQHIPVHYCNEEYVHSPINFLNSSDVKTIGSRAFLARLCHFAVLQFCTEFIPHRTLSQHRLTEIHNENSSKHKKKTKKSVFNLDEENACKNHMSTTGYTVVSVKLSPVVNMQYVCVYVVIIMCQSVLFCAALSKT